MASPHETAGEPPADPPPPCLPPPVVTAGSAGVGGSSSATTPAPRPASAGGASFQPAAPTGAATTGGVLSEDRAAKRQRLGSSCDRRLAEGEQAAASSAIFGDGAANGKLFLGAQAATVVWRIDGFPATRQRADGACLDGPKFGPREPWQIFCHPDGRCFNQPQGGPPGVFLRYLGPHERVPAYATIEKLLDGEFCVPENNARDAPFVVLFGRNEIEEWGVCKDFGLFDDAFCRGLDEEALVLRARVTWIEPRPDSLLPREIVGVRRNSATSFAGTEGSLQADLGVLWQARRPAGCSGGEVATPAGPSGGAAPALPVAIGGTGPAAGGAVPADLVLLCEGHRFEADRAILAARSSFFGAMLSSRKFCEAEQREVELPEVPARALASALRFVYTDEGPPEMQSREEAEELLTVSSKLGISGLMRLCSDNLRDNFLNIHSAVGLLRLADEHGAAPLRAEALAVLGAGFDQVKSTPEWEGLLRTGMNPVLIQDTIQAVQDAAIFAGRASIKL